ncbi:MAG: 5'-methylthioadenosine/S-adenosylhomocysteine nucleosidase [Corynebacterium sp.]|nr:5'-methylthioadenosine/S-adenosylhomocysteine nucleosidase [Corynebacterium sp.]
MHKLQAIISVAMPEEAQPYLEAQPFREIEGMGQARFYLLEREAGDLLLIQSGIGLVAASSALAAALTRFSTPTVISGGTAGGLGRTVEVGDICISTQLAYTDVDATAFGYVRGQNPGQPERFHTPEALTQAARAAAESVRLEGQQIHVSEMLAGNSFVTAHNVKDTREAFPEAISTDMESVALAQVCHAYGLDFISVRGVSDLCGPEAGQDFHMDCGLAATRSTNVILAWYS